MAERAERLRKWYRLMCLIRRFDEVGIDLFNEKLVRGSIHPYVGQEAGAAGLVSALRDDDLIFTYYRGHGHCLARGLEPTLMMAELMGRRDGYCRGKGGTMHITSYAHGVMGTDGVVGGMLPVAVGTAYALRLDGGGRIAVVFFGDGAVNQGVFHEAVNLAGVFDAPVLFVCENNQWAVNSRSADLTAGESIVARAASYGIRAEAIESTDVEVVHELSTEMVRYVATECRPAFLELRSYRWLGHSAFVRNDPRPPDERELWLARDPIAILGERLISEGMADASDLETLRGEAEAEVRAAEAFGRSSPELTSADIATDVFARAEG